MFPFYKKSFPLLSTFGLVNKLYNLLASLSSILPKQMQLVITPNAMARNKYNLNSPLFRCKFAVKNSGTANKENMTSQITRASGFLTKPFANKYAAVAKVENAQNVAKTCSCSMPLPSVNGKDPLAMAFVCRQWKIATLFPK